MASLFSHNKVHHHILFESNLTEQTRIVNKKQKEVTCQEGALFGYFWVIQRCF